MHVGRLVERVQELEAGEARVRELEADALMRTMEGEASFSSTSSRGAYEPPFDSDWVSYWTCWIQALKQLVPWQGIYLAFLKSRFKHMMHVGIFAC